MAETRTESRKRNRAPLLGGLRRIVDAVEDVIDDVVARGETVERDARKLVKRALKNRDDKDREVKGGDGDGRSATDHN